MAKPSPPTLKPKTTSFLICFRYSKNKTLRSHDDDDKKKLKISKKSTSTTRSSWLCCSAAGFRLKKAAATKTVPLDISTVSPQPNNPYTSSSSAKLVDEPEPESKSKHVKFQVPAVPDIVEDPGVPLIQRRLIVSDVITPAANSKRKPPETVSDTINLENRTRQQLGSDNACQKRRLSFCRKVDSIRTTAAAANGSQPGSPFQQPRTVGAAPPPKRTRRGRGGGTVGASSTTSLARQTWLVSNERMNMMTSSMRRKRLDPVVGMTIIMVTLIIMVLWGRLCAILCTAAWLYLLPRLSTTHQINGNSNLTTSTATATSSTAGHIFPHPRDDYYLDLMMSSDEYKKKVVLEGFLERNNHRTG